MMKTIYNLKKGDSYWVKDYDTYSGYPEPKKTRIMEPVLGSNTGTIRVYENRVKSGMVFLTEEECQRSIDYDIALAKIKKRASEFEQEHEEFYKIGYGVETLKEIYWDTGLSKLVISDRPIESQRSLDLYFPEEYVWNIIEELEQECKTVLGVQKNGK